MGVQLTRGQRLCLQTPSEGSPPIQRGQAPLGRCSDYCGSFLSALPVSAVAPTAPLRTPAEGASKDEASHVTALPKLPLVASRLSLYHPHFNSLLSFSHSHGVPVLPKSCSGWAGPLEDKWPHKMGRRKI